MKTLYTAFALAFITSAAFAQTQYADYVIAYSSEYHDDTVPPCNTTWAACQIIGAPDFFPNHGDNGAAWASKTQDGQREFIAVGFNTPLLAENIYVYETHNPNAIDTVYVRNAATQQWVMIWSDSAYDDGTLVQLMTVPVPDSVNYMIDGVRLAVNSPAVPGWNEIDAISVNDFIPLGLGKATSANVSVKLYPNPTNSGFTVSTGNEVIETVKIIDLPGRLVYEAANVNAASVNFSQPLARGIYNVDVIGKSFKQTLRLVVE